MKNNLKRWLLLGVIWLGSAVAVLALFRPIWYSLFPLHHYGTETTGTVVEIRPPETFRSVFGMASTASSHPIKYEYAAGGKIVVQRSGVKNGDGLSVGSKIRVWYLPSNPSTTTWGTPPGKNLMTIMPPFVVIVLALSAILASNLYETLTAQEK